MTRGPPAEQSGPIQEVLLVPDVSSEPFEAAGEEEDSPESHSFASCFGPSSTLEEVDARERAAEQAAQAAREQAASADKEARRPRPNQQQSQCCLLL
jgi:hypothetical protein